MLSFGQWNLRVMCFLASLADKILLYFLCSPSLYFGGVQRPLRIGVGGERWRLLSSPWAHSWFMFPGVLDNGVWTEVTSPNYRPELSNPPALFTH